MVPRTFLGALGLSLASLPFRAAFGALGLPKVFLLLAVRGTLAAGVCTSIALLSRAVRSKFGGSTAVAFLVALSASPHYLFYASRTLPNVFAMLLVARCAAHWLWSPLVTPSKLQRASASLYSRATHALTAWATPTPHQVATVAYLLVAMLWFRCDMLVLVVTVGVAWLVAGRATLPQLVAVGGVIAVVAVGVTVGVDTALWRRWLWPEAEVFLTNTTTGESEKYTDQLHAWHWYFSTAIPKGMVGALPFLPLGLLQITTLAVGPRKEGGGGRRGVFPWVSRIRIQGLDWGVCELTLPALAFIALLSLLKNKQPRFIFPVFPILFIAAGSGMAKVARLGMDAVGWGVEDLGVPTSRPGGDSAGVVVAGKSPVETTKAVGSTTVKYRGKGGKQGGRSASPAASRGEAAVPAPATVPVPSPAAKGASSSSSSPPTPPLQLRLLGLSVLSTLPLAMLLSALLTSVYVATSSRNYPGGVALSKLYSIVDRDMRRAGKSSSSTQGKVGLSTLYRSRGGETTHTPPPLCLYGDVTCKWGGMEWVRQCLCGTCPQTSHETLSTLASATNRSCTLPPTAAAAAPPASPIRIHVANAAAQEGVSRFLEPWSHSSWVISKEEHLMPGDFAGKDFDYIIAESLQGGGEAYGPIGTDEDTLVAGLPTWNWRQPFRVNTQPRLFLLKRIQPFQ